MSQHFAKTARETQYKRKSWNSFFRVLSQITASAPIQADAGAIQKIFDVITDLLERINESLNIESDAYSTFQADYQLTRSNLVNEISDTELIIGTLEAEIEALSHRIDQAKFEESNQN